MAHGLFVINASSTFANETGLMAEKRIAFNLIMFAIEKLSSLLPEVQTGN